MCISMEQLKGTMITHIFLLLFFTVVVEERHGWGDLPFRAANRIGVSFLHFADDNAL